MAFFFSFSIEDMKHKRGMINLQGRKLQAAAFFSPPLSYLSSTINKTVNGVEGEFFLANNRKKKLNRSISLDSRFKKQDFR